MRRHYDKQIRAIQPILEHPGSYESLSWFLSSGQAAQEEFTHYLVAQGLAGHWYHVLSDSVKAQKKCPTVFTLLERYMSAQQSIYYNQTSVLGKLHNLMKCNDILYAVIKGVHIREVLYSPPWFRSCEDIDILIDPKDKFRVAKILSEHGFKAYPDIKTITNDLTFAHGAVSVDLHWDILRPSRLEHSMTEELLSTRIDQNDYYGLSPEAIVFMMLIHPVFKKYLTTPQAYLSRIIDLYFWVKNHSLDWKEIFRLCDKSGLKTAAWLTSTYYTMLTGNHLNEHFINSIKPSKAKAAYLHFWLDYNLSTRFVNLPFIPQLLFTLAAHDTTRNSLAFLSKNRALKKESLNDLKQFEKFV